ncbi:MAG TPA: hypothetical protein PKW90_16480, partial [Myxococcota bacterium]|nr:hypothetical protein [Myxococcota bacterium]
MLLLLACALRPPTAPAPTEPPAAEAGSPETPAPEQVLPASVLPAAAAAARPEVDEEGFLPQARNIPWPLWTYQSPPDAAMAPLPGPPQDLDLHPREGWALVLREGRLFRWDYQAPVQALDLPGLAPVLQAAFSPFDGSLYLIVSENTKYRIERWDLDKKERKAMVYQADFPLADLVVPFLQWDGRERLFFSGKGRILSCTRAGKRCYEVTSPDGKASPLTDPELAKPPQDWNM